MSKYTISIHGGAGTIVKGDMTPELEQAYISAMNEALTAGYSSLSFHLYQLFVHHKVHCFLKGQAFIFHQAAYVISRYGK